MHSLKIRKVLSWICLLSWMVYFSLILSSCVEEQEIYDAILPNFIIICIHTLATIILIILSIWLVWNPTKKIISKRREYIEKNLNDSESNKKESIARLLEAENKRMQAYEEAQLIIDRAKNEANYEGESILQLANDDAKMIYKNAKRDAKLLKQEIIKDNDKRINEIALSVCKTIIKKQITKKNNDRLIKDILNNSKKDGGVE
ncbi:MAG: hypothetical protein LBB95_01535 [Mycoplasmataceae bacterium]|nr:hypothetical protein [Mycoplasmataceae bacterium]